MPHARIRVPANPSARRTRAVTTAGPWTPGIAGDLGVGPPGAPEVAEEQWKAGLAAIHRTATPTACSTDAALAKADGGGTWAVARPSPREGTADRSTPCPCDMSLARQAASQTCKHARIGI